MHVVSYRCPRLAEHRRPLAFVSPSLDVAGAQRMTVGLVREASRRGFGVDLLTRSPRGPLAAEIPEGVRVIDLNCRRMRHAVWRIGSYLRRARPRAVISRMTHANVCVLLARMIARTNTRVAVVEATHLSSFVRNEFEELHYARVSKSILVTARLLYRHCDTLVGVSDDVTRDMQRFLRVAPGRVQTIYNPTVDERVEQLAGEPPPHPWLVDSGPPVIVAVGRLAPVKDLSTLLRAVALLRRRRPVRLIVVGEGAERDRLEREAAALHIADVVAMPGMTLNPLAYMSRAAAVALTSRCEGLPNVLIEAMACGVPVVSTDCPGGSSEILSGGRYGRLVPVGDAAAVAGALEATLDAPAPASVLRARASDFSASRSLDQYLHALGIADMPGPSAPGCLPGEAKNTSATPSRAA